MNHMQTQQNRQRVWEIDALRGLLILCVLATHLYYTVDAFCINGYYDIDSYAYVNATDPLHFWFEWGEDGVIYKAFLSDAIREKWIFLGVDGFFVISGISCMFSRDNLKSGIRLLIAAYAISAFTYALSIWTDDPTRFIRFGVLHCYAYCHLLFVFLLENRSNKTLLLLTIPIFIIGYFLRYHGVHAVRLPFLYIFGVRQLGDQSGDYWPILPMMGWFLIGVVLGRKYYPEKKSLLSFPMAKKLTRPLQWLGRRSGIIYVSHIVIYTAIFCGIGILLNLL